MRSTVRAFHLLLLAFCSVIALMAAILASTRAVSLGDGFEQYLNSQDAQAFDRVTAQFHKDVEEMVGAGIVDPERLRAGLIARLTARRQATRTERDLFREEGRRPSEGSMVADAMFPRLILLDPEGTQLYGPPMLQETPAHLQRLEDRIEFASRTLVTIRALPRPPIAPGANNAYITSRYRAIGLAALTVLLCGTFFAWLTARYISRWLERLRDSLAAIAARRFDTEVPLGITTEQREIGMAVTEMAETLREADTRRRRWFAEVGHEIRTPLTILRGELEALIDGIRSTDKAALQSLQEEALRLTRVTEDLRLLSLAELGEVALAISGDDATDRCRAAVERWRKPAEKAGLSLILSSNCEQCPVHWDRHKIERVIDNLMTNALRYTSAPGTIRLDLLAEEERVTISVEDSAPGVPTELLEEIFEPLSRAMRSATDPDGGSGLGLAIVQAVVEGHGGMVGASHSALGGLRVVLSVPRRTP